MPDVKLKGNRELEWEEFYPQFMDWNRECDENDRWYVEIRKRPSWKQAMRVRAAFSALAESEDTVDRIDQKVGILAQYCRGPFNLKIDGELIDDLILLLGMVDSVELFSELWAQVKSGSELTEEEVGNSDGSSSGDQASEQSVSPQSEETPAPPACETPESTGAQEPTTQSPEKDSENSVTLAPDDGPTTRTEH